MPDTPDPAVAGGTVTYQIGIADAGGNPQPAVTLNVDIPANGRYRGTGSLPAGVSCGGMAVGQLGPGVVTCTGINIPAMGGVQVPIRVSSTASGTMTLTATPVGGAPQSETTTINVGADLSIAVNAPASVPAGSTQNVQLVVSNAGPDDSPSSTLTYSVPPGFVPTGTPAGCSIVGSTMTCALGAITVGNSRSVTVTGIIGAGNGSTITHTADVAAGGGVGDGIADNNVDSATTNVTPGTTLTVTKTKSMADPVTVGDEFNFQFAPRFSGDAPATLTLSDTLPNNFCPVSASFNSGGWSCTASSSCPTAGGTLTCTRAGTGSPGANVSLGTVSATVRALTNGVGVVNTATLSAAGVTDGQGSVNTTVIDPSTDLRANKSKSWPQAAVPVGQPFDYTISATNLGPSPVPAAATVTLTDTVPANLQINSIPAGCSSSGGAVFPQTGPQTVTCNITGTAIAVNGQTPNRVINVQATVAGVSITNQMCVSSTGAPADPSAANDCASVIIQSQAGGSQAGIRTLKAVLGLGNAPGNRQQAGEPITWTLEVVNDGPQTATQVAVTDTLNNVFNANASQYSLSTNAGAATMGACSLVTSGSGVSLDNCSITTLPICTQGVDCPVISITVRPTGNGTAGSNDFSVTNSAFALAQNEADSDLANNTATATAFLTARADVSVTKSDNPDPATVGQLLTYTITASNPSATSASMAHDVSVVDTLPHGLVMLSAVANGSGTCTGPAAGSTTGPGNDSLTCGWASIARGAQQTVTIRVRPVAALAAVFGGPGSITNNVVISTSTPEVAGGAANNSATQPTALNSPAYDLIINNTDDVDPANVGDAVIYTLTVTNNAASTAENVRVTDTLSAVAGAPTFDSIVGPLPAGVSCDTSGVTVGQPGGSLVCVIDQLGGTGANATGEANSVQIRVRLVGASKGSYTNAATVNFVNAAMNAFDPQANNTANEPTTFRFKADVEVVSKTAVQAGTSTPITAVGQAQAFDWLVQLRNNGPHPAENDSFTDTLPAHLQLAGAPVLTVTAGVFTPAAPLCTGVAGGTVVSCSITSMPANGTAIVRIPVQVVGAPAINSVLTNTARFITTGSGDTNGGADPNAGNNHNSGSVTVMSSAVSGRVYEDLNGNGQPDPGEPGIPGVQIAINGPVNLTTTTDAAGNWSFTVPPGTYQIVETQPAGYLGGITRAGSVSGAGSSVGTVPTSGPGVQSGPHGSTANTIQTLVLGSGGMSTNNNFGEVRPASLSGLVYVDANGNDRYDAGELGIDRVGLLLTGTDDLGQSVSLAGSTASDGSYNFAGLRPGVYSVTETQPNGFADGAETVGSAGGALLSNDVIDGIQLGSGTQATDYHFGERSTRLTVHVFEDPNDDGMPALNDAGIPGVTITLTGVAADGTPVLLVARPIPGQPGHYEFPHVPPSNAAGYTLTETQPANYAPGKANVNGQPGTAQPNGNVITGIVVPSVNTPPSLGTYNFGERVPSQIQGRSFYDRDGDGQQGAPEPGIPGVTITLTGTDDRGNPVNRTTTTNANGDYLFDAVGPGRYTVTETRPAGYLPGLTHAGTVTGAGSAPGTVPASGDGVTVGPLGSDAPVIQNIVLGSPGSGSTQNNFASVRTASLAGFVYADIGPANGQRDAGEPAIPGVTITLSGTDLYGRSVQRTVTTDAQGAYAWTDLLPGRYQLDETQPAGMADGAEQIGTVGGVTRGTANPGGVNDRFADIALASEDQGVDYNFGERGGQIGGQVYVDGNDNGQRDPGELPIAGVTLTLTGRTAHGQPVNLTVVTDAQGRYVFDGVLPSDAAGYTITETQPVTYADGKDSVGRIAGQTTGRADGNDRTVGIVYNGGTGEGYDFGERGASLTGQVFNDVNGNTKKDLGDLPMAGVTVTLTGTDASGQPVTRTTVTGPDGRYRFDDLPLNNGAGYTITQSPVPDSTHVGEVPGSLGGSVPAPRQLQVTLPSVGAHGVEYDFFERLTRPSSLSGSIWRDKDHDRNIDADELPVGGWTVELVACPDASATCAPTEGRVLDTRTTGSDGGYRFDNLVPGNYQIRFRDPQGHLVGGTWPTDPVLNGPGGLYPTQPRGTIPVTIAGNGVDVVRQDLPLDPGGVVFDSLSGQPVPGAQVVISGPPGFDPSKHLLSGQGTVNTGADGSYQFFLLPSAPAGSYKLSVVPPSGYLPSSAHPPAPSPLDVASCSAAGVNSPAKGGAACVANPLPQPLPDPIHPYFLEWTSGGLLSQVVNNHIPLDRVGITGLIELRKTSAKVNVRKGEPVPYVITARNTSGTALGNVILVDTLPPGFKYLEGSLTVQTLPNGPVLPMRPVIQGRQLSLPALPFGAAESKRISMVLGVGIGVGEGQYVNSVVAQQGSQSGVPGRILSNTANAAVRVVPDALLDCTDLIGKVYDDRNANGVQDEGEPGLAGVRLATVNGLLVTTDAQGRYHVACAAVPKDGTGSNLVLKLDERTLPSGYRVTTENPAAERATRGKLLRIDFGATVHRVLRLDLRSDAFETGAAALLPTHQATLARAVEVLRERPSVLRLSYRPAQGEPAALGQDRVAAIRADLLKRWTELGRQSEQALFDLAIEVEIQPAAANK